MQNNPDFDGSLRQEINALKKEQQTIIIKSFTFENVVIDRKSVSGMYFTYMENFFPNNNIDLNKVVGMYLKYWQGVSNAFNVFMQVAYDFQSLGFFATEPVTANTITVGISYLK